jgi:hypothetical protein
MAGERAPGATGGERRACPEYRAGWSRWRPQRRLPADRRPAWQPVSTLELLGCYRQAGLQT